MQDAKGENKSVRQKQLRGRKAAWCRAGANHFRLPDQGRLTTAVRKLSYA